MSLTLMVYLASICDSINVISLIAFIITLVASLIALACAHDGHKDEDERLSRSERLSLSKLSAKLFIGSIFAGILLIAVPSTDSAYKIIAVESVRSLGDTPEAAKLRVTINKSLDLINSKLNKEESK